MKHIDLLETEYKEQYNQYRWIGRMQSVVLTFYGAVATFSLLAAAALRPQPPTPIDYRWIAGVLGGVGLLGIFVGIALFRSRSMQRRTAWYLTYLLDQMASNIEDASAVEESALRYRGLCTTGGRFKLMDTMNAAFLIALFSGETLFICGSAVFSVTQFEVASERAIAVGLVIFLVTVVLTPIIVQRYLMDAETKRMRCDYFELERSRGLEQMRKKSGLPEP